jgi:hypothetical protein
VNVDICESSRLIELTPINRPSAGQSVRGPREGFPRVSQPFNTTTRINVVAFLRHKGTTFATIFAK